MTRVERCQFYFFIFLLLVTTGPGFYPTDFSSPIDRIAFGSCNRETLPQPLWRVIQSNRPDLWIWMGDNIYGDSEDVGVIAKKYEVQFNHPDYQPFRQVQAIIGTWDDHDYGWNNAGAEYPKKADTRDLALDFLEVPADHPRRERKGLYGTHIFGPIGKQVQVVLLDGRYFAEKPGMPEADLLGSRQEEWLRKTLYESTAQVILLVSGIQFLPEDHKYEKWANFPRSRQWLFRLLEDENLPGIILLSGDRHFHEISELQLNASRPPLVEITSSGMTHSWESLQSEPNRHRVGTFYNGKGFGMLHFNWEPETVQVTAEIRNDADKSALQHSFTFPLTPVPTKDRNLAAAD